MNEGISVRTCNEKDVDVLVSLGIKTFRDAFDEFNTAENMMLYINKTFNRKVIERDLKNPAVVYFLALDGRVAVGYSKVKIAPLPEDGNDSFALEIEKFYARKDYHGKKVGYMLMKTCLAFARKKALPAVWLGVWENNARAIAFYEKNGFVRFGQQTFVLGNDAQTDWLMKKEL